MRTYNVATFANKGKDGKIIFTAYTRIYSPSWEGFIGYTVEAENGTQAKKIAIRMRKEHESKDRR